MNDVFYKYRDRFIELAEQIKCEEADKHFKIVVIGKYGSGKSTLINALLGEKIMAMKATACTGVISEIEYGRNTKIRTIW